MVTERGVYVFGNPDLPEDALPLQLLPQLQKRFPDLSFYVKDPNEEWDVPTHLIIIDTVMGIEQVQTFHDLQPFSTSPRISMHDFDALAQLRLMQKVGKLGVVTVIGVPPAMKREKALDDVTSQLRTIVG